MPRRVEALRPAVARITPDLTDDELLSAAFLLPAGYENVAHVLGNGLHELLTGPAPRSAPAVSFVDEIPPHASPVQLALASAHRDGTVGGDPDTFDADRPDNLHLAFGHGPHVCLGAPLARLELKIGFDTPFHRYPAMTPAGDPVWRSSFRSRGPATLPVILRLTSGWFRGRRWGLARPRRSAAVGGWLGLAALACSAAAALPVLPSAGRAAVGRPLCR
ncbi:cytochrome P450 [Amycolatopsis sp. NPDC049253]|uniref:cytochrome P450 n=1 Tax=Amycolatopsis sp. NPDC049253 TaxID=3155274 RepID=UPI003426579A